MTTEDLTQWLSPAQAARALSCSVPTVHNLADKGKLVMQRTAIGRLISAESVEALKEERKSA